MRPGVAQADRQRDLRIAAFIRSDASRGAAKRVSSVGADHEWRVQTTAAFEPQRNRSAAGLDRLHFVFNNPQHGQRSGALLKRGDQMPVFDIGAERLETDFVRLERHLRRSPQPSGVVDNAHRAQRRGVGRAGGPDA